MIRKGLCFILIIIICLLPVQISAYYFRDLDRHWSEEHVYWAVYDVPVFSGYPDGSFRPDQLISRAEYLTMVSKIIQSTVKNAIPSNSILSFIDLTSNHWAYPHVTLVNGYLAQAPQADLMISQIFTGNRFLPNQPISRLEAAVLTHSIMTPPIRSEALTTPFIDVSALNTHYHRINELAANGIFSGYEDGSFRPNGQMTRAEAAVIARRIYQDLSYLQEDLLQFELDFGITEPNFPTLDMPSRRMDYTSLDSRMNTVIATLEEIAIVGFIMRDLQHLYDRNPIETLWELKNAGYEHVLANNYYLLAYDTTLQSERRSELAREALITYGEQSDQNVNGMIHLFREIYFDAPVAMLTDALYNYLDTNLTSRQKEEAVMLLSHLLISQGREHEATRLYSMLIDESTDIEGILILVQQDIAIRHHLGGAEPALLKLEEYWQQLRTNSRYSFFQDEIEFQMTALQKQLMVQLQ